MEKDTFPRIFTTRRRINSTWLNDFEYRFTLQLAPRATLLESVRTYETEAAAVRAGERLLSTYLK